MKRQNTKTQKKSVLATLVALGFFAVGCGMNAGTNGNNPFLNGNGIGNGLGANGCGVVQVGSSITFSAQNAYVDFYRIIAGQLPHIDPMYPGQNVGWMRVNGNGALGPINNLNTGLMNTNTLNNLNAASALTGSSYTGTSVRIQITQAINPNLQNGMTPMNFGGGTQFNTGFAGAWNVQPASQVFANFQGTLTLGINDVQRITSLFPQNQLLNGGIGNTLLPGQTNGTVLNPIGGLNGGVVNQANRICISGISMNMGYMNNRLYNGLVYLYLNGTQHGIWVQL